MNISVEYIKIVVSHLYSGTKITDIAMILQKQKAREYKGKSIYKYVIVIPPKDVEELGWKEGQGLKGIVINNKGYFLS